MGATHGHHPAKITELTWQQHPAHVPGEGTCLQKGRAQVPPAPPSEAAVHCGSPSSCCTPKDWIIPKAPHKGIVCFYPSIHTQFWKWLSKPRKVYIFPDHFLANWFLAKLQVLSTASTPTKQDIKLQALQVAKFCAHPLYFLPLIFEYPGCRETHPDHDQVELFSLKQTQTN